MSQTPRDPITEQALNFLFAGIANGTSAAITNPVDVVKVRMQIDNELTKTSATQHIHSRYYKGIGHGLVVIGREEGLRGLYRGLAPSVARDFLYSGFRVGAYEPFKRLLGGTDPAHTPLWIKMTAGAISGSIGSAALNPTDLVKVRMQAYRPGQPRLYKHSYDAILSIVRKHGLAGLYVGMGPTVLRAAVVTASQVPAYDHTKHTLLNYGILKEGYELHIISAMSAGLCAAVASSPVDVMKTRVMNQKRSDCGKFGSTYTSTFDAVVQSLRHEGPMALYKGFIANWMRLGPHTIISFFTYEQLRSHFGISPL